MRGGHLGLSTRLTPSGHKNFDKGFGSSYAAIGANAAKWVPLLKIVFESLYYAAFPMAVLMMMTPLALPVFKGYLGGFVWIAAWEPLSVILHSIVIKASTGFYREAGAVTSDGSVSDVVLSWATETTRIKNAPNQRVRDGAYRPAVSEHDKHAQAPTAPAPGLRARRRPGAPRRWGA